jgi:hypothetical protein
MKKITKKQNELKKWIRKLDWTQNKFARRYYFDQNDTDIESEIKQFTEKFKKQLSRPTTKVERIDTYLEYLYSLDEFKRNNFVKPQNYSALKFDQEFNCEMKKISEMISRKL